MFSYQKAPRGGEFLFLLGQADRTAYSEWIGGDSYHSLVLETPHNTQDKDYIAGELLEDPEVRRYEKWNWVGIVKTANDQLGTLIQLCDNQKQFTAILYLQCSWRISPSTLPQLNPKRTKIRTS